MRLIARLLLLSTGISAVAQTVTPPVISQPAYGFNIVPNSVRRVVALPDANGTTSVNWSVSGGCTLSNTSGAFTDIIAPTSGSSCSWTGSAVASNTSCLLSATSQVDSTKSSSVTVNVCAPQVIIAAVPFYTVLYSGQSANLQSFVWGNGNRRVSWQILAQPSGGDATLDDTQNADTVFQATVAGRYTLSVTSQADPTKSATVTIFVTGHPMPYLVTKNQTLPVDCTPDPASTGSVYEVGPNRAYTNLVSIPWSSLPAGSTVRIHNDDTTGLAPTTYNNYFQISTHATPTQPLRVCGVPDALGNLPVISGANATTRTDTNYNVPGYGLVDLLGTGWNFWNQPSKNPAYILVEGISVQHSSYGNSYYTPAGVLTPYGRSTSGIRIQNAQNVVIRGNEMTDDSLGFFSESVAPEAKMTRHVLFEGNYLHNNGVAGYASQHQAYMQGFGEVVQFNIFDTPTAGMLGSQLKGRGVYDIVRYNYFGDGATRQNDFVDNQDAYNYLSYQGYYGGTNPYYKVYPADTYGSDNIAAAQEGFHNLWVYGNTYNTSTSTKPIHFFADMTPGEQVREGTLWFYNNSFFYNTTQWKPVLFDLQAGSTFAHAEWNRIEVHNNAVWLPKVGPPYFTWSNYRTGFMNFGNNIINAGWGNNNQNCVDNTNTGKCYGTGWSWNYPSNYFMDGINLASHTTGSQNILTTATAPFNTTTLVPVAGSALIGKASALPSRTADMPVRFQFGRQAGYALKRADQDLGAISSTAPSNF